MSITAVSPDTIVVEEFDNSNFWHKLEHMLIVYYLYASSVTVKAADYADFPIKGYEFYEFNSKDREILKNDWNGNVFRLAMYTKEGGYIDNKDKVMEKVQEETEDNASIS